MPVSVIVAVVVRPWLWGTAIGTVFAMAPRRWWSTPPFLPLPDRELLEWRKATAYGNPTVGMEPDDVVSYLTWRRTNRKR